MEEQINGLSLLLAIIVVSFFGLVMTYLMVKVINILLTYKLKSKIKKYNLKDYNILSCYRGVPNTIQLKADANKIIYL